MGILEIPENGVGNETIKSGEKTLNGKTEFYLGEAPNRIRATEMVMNARMVIRSMRFKRMTRCSG